MGPPEAAPLHRQGTLHPPNDADRVVTYGVRPRARASRPRGPRARLRATGRRAGRRRTPFVLCVRRPGPRHRVAAAGAGPEAVRAATGRSDGTAMFHSAAFRDAAAERIRDLSPDVLVSGSRSSPPGARGGSSQSAVWEPYPNLRPTATRTSAEAARADSDDAGNTTADGSRGRIARPATAKRLTAAPRRATAPARPDGVPPAGATRRPPTVRYPARPAAPARVPRGTAEPPPGAAGRSAGSDARGAALRPESIVCC